MKKVFTLLCGLFCFAGVVMAASTINDVKVCKHSYVLIGDDYTNDGTVKPLNYTLIGDGYFLLVGTDPEHSVSTGKGSVDLSSVDGVIVTEEIAAKYGEYGSHRNSLRLKEKQDGVALKVTAHSKIIIFYENNKAEARRPLFCSAVDKGTKLADQGTMVTAELNSKGIGRVEWTAPDDMDLYILGENQLYLSYLIVEANEAQGTPQVKVGPQQVGNEDLWYREVTCKSVEVDGVPTIVTYTTDGTEPTAASTVYTAPIRAYKDQVIKFQAFLDGGDGKPNDELKCEGADNEAPVTFSFDAPILEAHGGSFSVLSPYYGAKNYFSYGEVVDQEGNGATLTESATVTAYSKIENGTYTTFTSKSVSADVFVLNDIKEEKNITVSGTAVEDAEATATSTTGTVYKIENGAVDANKMDFFIKNLTFGVLANADAAKAKYQVPAGQEAYIQMSNTTIAFSVAEGDSTEITVVCSKNSCKNIDETDEDVYADKSKVADNRKCFVNVDGTNYGGVDLKENPDGNVITFRVGPGIHTFQKYSGTGNILISSIKFVPMIGAGVENLAAAEQKVAAKKVFRNGRLVIETANGTFNVAGVRVK